MLSRRRPTRQPRGSRGASALVAMLLLASPALMHAQTPAGDDAIGGASTTSPDIRIVVNRVSEADASGGMTLAAAIKQAAGSAATTVITFDPDLPKPVSIKLDEAITIASPAASIRIDASALGTGVILDATQSPDSALIVGGNTRLFLVGMNIRGGKQRGILCKDHAHVTLERVMVSDGSMPGLAAFGDASITIIDSRLMKNRTHGLEIHGQSIAVLERVDLSQNGQAGIAAFDTATIKATRCRLDANTEWGAVLTDSSRGEFTHCTFTKSRFANSDVSGSATLITNDCDLLDAQRFGVFATGKSHVQLNATRIARSGSRGIEAQDHTAIELSTCRIEGSADYGLILFGQASVQASESLFNGNAAHGASLRGSARGSFLRCSFTRNKFSGLGCLDGHDGGAVKASQCVFRQNGMRPIYRGPLHLDPLVPTPLRVRGSKVQCMADPGATIELYLDRVGEASRFIGTITADESGHFVIDETQVPSGSVMTAAATANGSTSEFNVIAGSPSAAIMDALIGRTGPLSDEGGEINLDMMLRRWKPGTQLVFQLGKAPSTAVEKYVGWFKDRVPEWTAGEMRPDIVIGNQRVKRQNTVVIPVNYVDPDAEQLASRGGVTYMRWDASGFFLPPMEIVLALGRDPQETCPRVLAHEIGHSLGLCHARVGLLSRMQGSAPPGAGYINDFSPTMTYYDVIALRALHDRGNTAGVTLRQLVDRGTIPAAKGTEVAAATTATLAPTASPPSNPTASASPSGQTQ